MGGVCSSPTNACNAAQQWMMDSHIIDASIIICTCWIASSEILLFRTEYGVLKAAIFKHAFCQASKSHFRFVGRQGMDRHRHVIGV